MRFRSIRTLILAPILGVAALWQGIINLSHGGTAFGVFGVVFGIVLIVSFIIGLGRLFASTGSSGQGTVFPSQMRGIIFRYGLIAGAILVGIELALYALSIVLLPSLIAPSPTSGQLIFTMFVLFAVIPALPVLYWAGKTASQRTGLPRVGLRVGLVAYGWWAVAKIVLLILDIQLFNVDAFAQGMYGLSALLLVSACLGMGWIGGQAGARQNTSYARSYAQGQQGFYAPAAFTPSPGYPQPASQGSTLDILQQRYARGEIDAATFQHMRAQLEGSNRPQW